MKSLKASMRRVGVSAMTGGGGGRSLASQYVFSAELKSDIAVQRGTGPLTFTRATAQTYVDGSGVLQSVASGTAAFESLGIKLEPVSTNLFLNSAVGVTQNITTTAIPFTLSFYGTGTITKSGTATGALVGTGANDRVTQTFTPSAGTLTLTVSGSCTNVQCEALPHITSPIITAGAAATRNATVLTGPLTANLPSGTKHISLYFSTAGYLAGTKQYLWSSRTDANNEVSIWHNGVIVALEKKVAGVSEYVTYDLTPTLGTNYLVDAYIYSDNTLGLAINGTLQSGTLGGEFYSDPTFDVPGAWSTSAGWSVGSGVATAASAASGGYVYTGAGSLVDGKLYQTQFTALSRTAGGYIFQIGGASVGTVRTPVSFPTTYTEVLQRTTGALVGIKANGVTSGTIGDISLKRLLNNSTTLAPVFAATFEVGSSASLNQLNGNLNSLKIYSR